MPSAPTHLVTVGVLGAWFYRYRAPWHLWLVAATLAVIPDLDVIGFRFGIAYEDILGHRGLSHSLPFAALVSGFATLALYRRGAGGLTATRSWVFLFLAMASHGVLDAFTNGGLGIAFFSPFSDARYFFPVRPLEVSPLSIQRFLSARGAEILANELLFVWLPAGAVAAIARALEARSRAGSAWAATLAKVRAGDRWPARATSCILPDQTQSRRSWLSAALGSRSVLRRPSLKPHRHTSNRGAPRPGPDLRQGSARRDIGDEARTSIAESLRVSLPLQNSSAPMARPED